MEREHANLLAAIAWASEAGDAEATLRLWAALWRFWLTRGHLGEGGAGWTAIALGQAVRRACGGVAGLEFARGRMLANYHGDSGGVARAREVPRFSQIGNEHGLASALQCLNHGAGVIGDCGGAGVALGLFRALGDEGNAFMADARADPRLAGDLDAAGAPTRTCRLRRRGDSLLANALYGRATSTTRAATIWPRGARSQALPLMRQFVTGGARRVATWRR
ncbi:MAG: hypothetical protein U0841_27555 [Chloroflexia bacterium]